MATSLADALNNTGTIPPVAASALNDNSKKSSLDDRLNSALDSLQKGQDSLSKEADDVSSGMKERQKQRESLDIPPIPTLDKPPQPQNRDPLQAFGSAAGWLAVFGSILTRQPLKTSLDAAAGVMNAWKQQDAAAAKQQFEVWKANTDNAIKLHDFSREYYKDEMDRLKAGDDSALNDLRAKAVALKDSTVVALANLKDRDGILKYQEAVNKANENIQKNQVKMIEMQEQMQGIAALKSDPKYIAASPQDKAKMIAEITNPSVIASEAKSDITKNGLTDDQYKTLKEKPEVVDAAASIHAGMLPSQAIPGFGANNPMREAALRLAKEKWPDDNLAVQHLKYIGKTAEARTLENKAINVKLAANILDSSLPSLIKAAQKVGLSPSTDLNAMVNAIREHANDPDYKNLQTQLRAVTTDYAQLIGRGKQTVHSDEEALGILNTKMNVGSLQGFSDAVTTEKNNLSTGISQTEKSLFGGVNTSSIPKEAVEQLQSDPSKEMRSHFDDVFGEGASDEVLGQ